MSIIISARALTRNGVTDDKYSVIGPIKLTVPLLLMAACCVAQPHPPNWSGNYPPCNRYPDLLKHEHVDLGVKISTSNAVLARQFALALEFWTGVLDLEWHEEDSPDCSIQLVDGTSDLFNAGACECLAARSHIPERPGFQGWVAFNPGSKLTEYEMFTISVHEIGHLLGLPHNPSGSSVMFFMALDDSVSLNSADLDALAGRHKLRAGIKEKVAVRIATPSN